jgi:hypothetical protein
MVDLVRYVCLDVGQGSGIFVEIYDDETLVKPPLHTMILDFGSMQYSTEAGGPSVEYVVSVLNRMPQPTLDAVLLSHGDADHIDLFPKVLKSFKPYRPDNGQTGPGTLQVLYAAFGGSRSTYKKRQAGPVNVLTLTETYMTANAKPADELAQGPEDLSCSFRDDEGDPACEVGPVVAYLLAGNVPNADWSGPKRAAGNNGYAINTLSLVTVLDTMGTQFVMTGDATGATLVWCNNKMTDPMRGTFLGNVVCVTAPHHASAKTIFDTGRADADGKDGEAVLAEFVDKINPKTTVASAGNRPREKHPSARVLRYFWERLPADGTPSWGDSDFDGRHFYTAHFVKEKFEREIIPDSDDDGDDDDEETVEDWPYRDAWYTVQTGIPLFTNTYYDAAAAGQAGTVLPPEPGVVTEMPGDMPKQPHGVAWIIHVTPGAVTEMIRRENRASLLRLRAAINAGLPPEQLPEVPLDDLLGGEVRSGVQSVAEPGFRSGDAPRRPARPLPARAARSALPASALRLRRLEVIP